MIAKSIGAEKTYWSCMHICLNPTTVNQSLFLAAMSSSRTDDVTQFVLPSVRSPFFPETLLWPLSYIEALKNDIQCFLVMKEPLNQLLCTDCNHMHSIYLFCLVHSIIHHSFRVHTTLYGNFTATVQLLFWFNTRSTK